jgi:hypothetical protein
MVFSASSHWKRELSVNNLELNRVAACKYFCVTLNEEVERRNHIEFVYSKFLKFVGIFYELRKTPFFNITNYLICIFHRHIRYCLEINANIHFNI